MRNPLDPAKPGAAVENVHRAGMPDLFAELRDRDVLFAGEVVRPSTLVETQRTVRVVSQEGKVIDYGLDLYPMETPGGTPPARRSARGSVRRDVGMTGRRKPRPLLSATLRGVATRVGGPGMPWGEQAQAARWAGTASATPGLLAFTGAIGSAEPHAHAAVQVLLVSDGEVVLTDRHGHRCRAEAAIIPAGVRHGLRASPGARGLLAYLDPAHPAARAACARIATAGDASTVSTWQIAARPLAAAVHGPATLPDVLGSIGPVADPTGFPRVLARALEAVPQLIGGPLLLGELAARIGVSASRLGHLFAEHLRLPFPAWRRWARLLHSIEAVRGGATLTEAAHAAGFADSSHLTRVCHEMFGLAPSHLVHLVRPTACLPTGPRSQSSGSIQAR
ncbi:helix-turn-helix transcriptional regulator [Actinosynnema sp. NPDC050436]|uniref:AraC family transcriptional regulator n=1 Tax=Actinosynnema sp. NPDC050436 TaxID=3155659 RepID=UPI0033DE0419